MRKYLKTETNSDEVIAGKEFVVIEEKEKLRLKYKNKEKQDNQTLTVPVFYPSMKEFRKFWRIHKPYRSE